MRKHGKVDANQGDIVDALEAVGATVQSLASMGGGCPDLLVGFRGRNYLMEIKNPKAAPNDRVLTIAECAWIKKWRGSVKIIETSTEALKLIGAI